jgi:hypothetical protein
MHTTGKIIIAAILVATCFIGWHIGAMIPVSVSAVGLGGIMGAMVAIPAALIAKQSGRADNHYHAHLHHHAPKALPTLPTVRKIVRRPTTYTVVQPALTANTQQQIGAD